MLNKGLFASVKVIGVGVYGVDMINWLSELGLKGVEFIAIHTDRLSLHRSHAEVKLGLTRGFYADVNPEGVRKVIATDKEKIKAVLHRSDIVFIIAEMGQRTEIVAVPAIAQMAKRLGALTIGIAIKPLTFEGRKKSAKAHSELLDMDEVVDTLIILSNDQLVEMDDNRSRSVEVFQKMNDSLHQKGVRHLEMAHCVR